jgi:hypothetical protein
MLGQLTDKRLTQGNGKLIGLRAFSLAASLMLLAGPGSVTAVYAAADPSLNFKIYSPQDPPAAGAAADTAGSAAESTPESPSADAAASPSADAAPGEAPKSMFEEGTPKLDTAQDKPMGALPADAGPDTEPAAPAAATPTAAAPAAEGDTAPAPAAADAAAGTAGGATTEAAAAPAADGSTGEAKSDKVLQGYIRVVPTGTKIPIIMDTAVDSDTSQEADEFSARTSEDLTIDGSTVVPAGSIIKGRIAQLNAPKAMNRSGSVALKFDTVTTPDNRQIPLVANIVARGGVVHARRGMKDIAIDASAVAAPMLIGGLIGVLAGKSTTTSAANSATGTTTSKHVGKAEGAAIGVGIGIAVGIIILCAKKGKKVEVRPGDELKIELAEDLRMPTI